MGDPSLSFRDLLLALAVVFVWGTNFVVIRLGLNALPPLLFASLRFTLVLLPMVLFLPRPKVPLANLMVYGVGIGLGQFGLLFIAMNGMISPGLASLVVQMQVFFTIALSMLRSSERLKSHQLAAFALAIAGIGVIVAHNGQGATILGLILTLGAAASWVLANQCAKEAGKVNALAYVVWASLFSLPPLYLLSLWREGWPAIAAGLSHATLATWAVVLWQSVGNTMFGYGRALRKARRQLRIDFFKLATGRLRTGLLMVCVLATCGLAKCGLAICLLVTAEFAPDASMTRKLVTLAATTRGTAGTLAT